MNSKCCMQCMVKEDVVSVDSGLCLLVGERNDMVLQWLSACAMGSDAWL